MNRVLIIEDESSIRSFIKINLKRNNFEVLEADTGEEGIRKVRIEKPDIVILDVMLPGIDGFKVCEILRTEYSNIGIIMLTARGQDMDKIMGLEFGADDYMVKPFNPLELVLRIKSLIRRIKKYETNEEELKSGPFVIDIYSQKVYKDNNELDLTPREYLFMKIFLENKGKAFKRDELLNLIWGYNFIGDSKIVDVNVRRLRSKIEDNPSNPIFIETIWGTGYRWNEI